MTINNTIKEKLENLANLPETDYPFITLYLNIHSHNFLEQNEINRIFIKDSFVKAEDKIKEKNDKDKLISFKKDEEKIKDYYNNKLDTRSHGLAFFACHELGLFEVFQSVIPFENSFIIDSFPHLKQLAYQADEYENAIVAIIDAKYARIFDVKLGGTIIKETDLENILHRFHKQGGWSQLRYQRHIEKQVENHFKEVSDIITKILDDENYKNVILIGQDQIIKNFFKVLPIRVQEKIIDMNQIQMRENINEIMEMIVNDLHKKEKEKELDSVNEAITQSLSGGLPILGFQDTIDAAKDGRISTLLTTKNYEHLGWKCGECLHITKEEHKPGCPECNGNTKETDLVEELIKLTFKFNGDIEILEDQSATNLEKYEGIGAYLRY